MTKKLLFTPGPVHMAENVRNAVLREDICHRSPAFERLLRSVEGKLLALFGVQGGDYRAVVMTGSGTSANEAMLSSAPQGTRMLVLSNGEFGERLFAIARMHHEAAVVLDFGWGRRIDIAAVEAYLEQNGADAIVMTHHETSSGMLNPASEIGALCARRGLSLFVDAVSSAGAEPLDLRACHVTFCSSSASKAVGAYPGLAFVVGQAAAFEKLKDVPPRTMYLDLYKFYRFMTEAAQTPNTPAVHLFYALEQALTNILEAGVAQHCARIRGRARLLRREMRGLGLSFLIDEADMCSVLTTVNVPPHLSARQVSGALENRGIIVYDGKGPFKGKVFQVGNIGELSMGDLRAFIVALREVLAEGASARRIAR